MNLVLKRVLAGRLADKYCKKCTPKSAMCSRKTYTESQMINEILLFSTPKGKDLKDEDTVTQRFSCFSEEEET